MFDIIVSTKSVFLKFQFIVGMGGVQMFSAPFGARLPLVTS
jgi:hypothetical protein